ncbi:MAG: lysophospholipid acyltransferase family protein [Polyangiaceae bacterium]
MIFRLLASAVAWLGPRGRGVLARIVAFLVYEVLRIRRAHVREAMARAGVGDAAAFYRELAGRAVELLAVGGGADLADRASKLTPGAEAALRTALAEGPVVVAASHTGNWECAAFALARHVEVSVVAKRQGVSSADRFVMDLRRRHGVSVIAPEGAVRASLEALARGAVVVLPIDQVPHDGASAVTVPFLGAMARVDRAPFVIAKRAGATLLVAAQEGANVHVLRVLSTRHGARRRGDVERLAAAATEALEAHVRAFPESWLWLHRRWRGAHDELPASPKMCSESRQVA